MVRAPMLLQREEGVWGAWRGDEVESKKEEERPRKCVKEEEKRMQVLKRTRRGERKLLVEERGSEQADDVHC